ncbi:hypothetical protein [Photobacterium sp. TLY01]|uniref:imm11 family protein n=1 Tax=Photobacterium sp. TLY01 TaxID=2907534 RepID=UPI001F1D685D|nr:hypothetical protein [Photobacterium sp. TLY01]UIP26719.1 hypothetical protein LN341_08645 [Photobacterium sp. TLY01]
MKYDSQYYILRENHESGAYMLEQADGSDEGLEHLMSLRSISKRVLGPGIVEVLDGDSSRFSPCDYHETAEQLISGKFRQVLLKFNLPGVDFYQTNIINGNKVWSDYYYLHIWNSYKCINLLRSEIDGNYKTYSFTLESLSLDDKVLEEIPLAERLVFRLEEKPKFLFHETVVNALREANLTGLKFLRVDEWSIGSAFE